MDLDLFLEEDIPIFLDGFEQKQKDMASVEDINSLLTPMQSTTTAPATEKTKLHFDDEDGNAITVKTNTVNIQTADSESLMHLGHKKELPTFEEDLPSTPVQSKELDDNFSRLQKTQPKKEEKDAPLPEGPITKYAGDSLPEVSEDEVEDDLVQEAKQSSEQHEEEIYLKALHLLHSHRSKEAISLFYGLLQKHPTHVGYKTRLFDALRLARSEERTALAGKSSFHHDAYAQALDYIKEKNYTRAQKILQHLAKQKPNNIAIHLRLHEVAAKLGDTYDN